MSSSLEECLWYTDGTLPDRHHKQIQSRPAKGMKSHSVASNRCLKSSPFCSFVVPQPFHFRRRTWHRFLGGPWVELSHQVKLAPVQRKPGGSWQIPREQTPKFQPQPDTQAMHSRIAPEERLPSQPNQQLMPCHTWMTTASARVPARCRWLGLSSGIEEKVGWQQKASPGEMTTIFKKINTYEHYQVGDEMMERFQEILACHPRFPLHQSVPESSC